MVEQTFSSGDHVYTFDVSAHSKLNLNFDENSQGTFICQLEGKGKVDVTINFMQKSTWTFLFLNKSDDTLEIVEHIYLHDFADVRLNYGELTKGKHKKRSVYELVGQDTNLLLKAASVVYDTLDWDLLALHHAKRSYARLDNHAIVLKQGVLNLEVSGRIDKGYSGSETHQTTRVMNFGEKVNARVFPKLLIDENDVAASHAAAVGKPDEEQVYYLQARGLSHQEALKLLMKGYLMPITNEIENEYIKGQLQDEIELKVEALWI